MENNNDLEKIIKNELDEFRKTIINIKLTIDECASFYTLLTIIPNEIIMSLNLEKTKEKFEYKNIIENKEKKND